MAPVAVVGAVVVAVVAWLFLFGRGGGDIWPRTWAVAAVLIAYSAAALALSGELGDAFGPVGPVELAVGAGAGLGWLAATHVGHAVLCRLFPSFDDQVRDLYALDDDQPVRRVLPPVLAMAVAEELLFRGVVQSQWGFLAGVAVYTAVQLVERKWALTLAAFLGGAVWGGLYWWTGSLAAPIVAHAVWTASLTLVWPLRGCGRDGVVTARAAPA